MTQNAFPVEDRISAWLKTIRPHHSPQAVETSRSSSVPVVRSVDKSSKAQPNGWLYPHKWRTSMASTILSVCLTHMSLQIYILWSHDSARCQGMDSSSSISHNLTTYISSSNRSHRIHAQTTNQPSGVDSKMLISTMKRVSNVSSCVYPSTSRIFLQPTCLNMRASKTSETRYVQQFQLNVSKTNYISAPEQFAT